MIFFLEGGEHIICLHKDFTIEHFLSNAKVDRRGYLGKIMCKIYNALTNPSVDMVDEYEHYYSKEYDSFKTFLIKQYPFLFDDQIESICEIEQSKKLKIYRGNFSTQTSYELDFLVTEEEGFEQKLISFLKYRPNEN